MPSNNCIHLIEADSSDQIPYRYSCGLGLLGTCGENCLYYTLSKPESNIDGTITIVAQESKAWVQFYEWMSEKGYADKSYEDYYFPAECFQDYHIKFTSQMLVGYMFEYLFEHGITIVSIPYEQQKMTDIQILHDYLKERIENMEV